MKMATKVHFAARCRGCQRQRLCPTVGAFPVSPTLRSAPSTEIVALSRPDDNEGNSGQDADATAMAKPRCQMLVMSKISDGGSASFWRPNHHRLLARSL